MADKTPSRLSRAEILQLFSLVQTKGEAWETVAREMDRETCAEECKKWFSFLKDICASPHYPSHSRQQHLYNTPPPKARQKKKRVRRKACEIERPYVCPHRGCNRGYGTEGALKQHIKLKHPHFSYTGTSLRIPSSPSISPPSAEEMDPHLPLFPTSKPIPHFPTRPWNDPNRQRLMEMTQPVTNGNNSNPALQLPSFSSFAHETLRMHDPHHQNRHPLSPPIKKLKPIRPHEMNQVGCGGDQKGTKLIPDLEAARTLSAFSFPEAMGRDKLKLPHPDPKNDVKREGKVGTPPDTSLFASLSY